MADNPLVSIICTTYNHEKFIKDAIDGFIIQKTNFPIEIIVHDDASTDSTVEIIKQYELKYPELFITIFQSENLYSKKEVNIWYDILFPRAKGKYIALCEGDDYWVDKNKLQKQVDFLEKNPDFSICFNKVKLLKKGSIRKDNITKVPKSVTNIFDLLKIGNYIHTNSIVFRNTKIVQIPTEIITADYALMLLLTKNGERIKYFKKPMSVYRIHSGGIWSLKNKKQKIKNEIVFYHLIKGNFEYEVSNVITSKFLFLISYYFIKYCCSKQEKEDFINWCKSRFDPFPFDGNYINALSLFQAKIEDPRYTFSIVKNKILSAVFSKGKK